ncbi:hypothetical protein QFC20_000929 [Naganishia adeliensis]|uniref:Uncharacterized protein n=1 Tax=Naganishia adeliensis TaxID=92952 RepID=A0ACC2WWU8_9TREE|nr:hypothetical protein QFC20_000929 [Naganishia adeliensis]
MSVPPATCAICSQPAKYTCPRCSTRTCSLPCSRTHKSTTGCTGERDKVAYVPLKDYGYGKLMDDYVFLEDGKRKAERWGKEIVGMKMDRDEGGGRQVVGKSLALRRALAERGIDVDFLPEGMERRRKNQSHYNQKTQLVQLSMEFKYASPDPSSTTSKEPTPIHQMQNIPLNATSTLHRIYTHQARKIPPHYPKPTDPSLEAGLVFAMQVYQPSGIPLPTPPTTASSSTTGAQRFYPPFSATDPLESVLQGTSFLEFPTIHVFLRTHWDRLVQEGRVAVVPLLRAPVLDVAEKKGSVVRMRETAESDTPNKKARIDEEDVPLPIVESTTTDTSLEPPPKVETSITDTSVTVTPPHLETKRIVKPGSEEMQVQHVATSGLALDYGTESEEGD